MRMNERRLRDLQRQFTALSRLETEYALAKLLREYDRLSALLAPLRKQLHDALSAGDLDRASSLVEQLARATGDFLRRLRPTQERMIEDLLLQAARRGAQSADIAPLLFKNPRINAEAIASFLETAASIEVGRATISLQYGRIAESVKQAIMRRVYQDGLNLSRRLHTRLQENIVEFTRIVYSGLTEGRGAIQLGRQLAELRVTDPQVPRYIRELRSALRGTDGVRKVDALADALRRIDPTSKVALKDGPLGLRTAVRNVVRAAQSGSADLLDSAIAEFVERKVRYHSIVIARTEANNAFTEGHNQRAKNAPYVIGSRWLLSSGRPSRQRPCQCEEYASQNWYGLGVGVFPPGELPARPHPNCMCYHTDVVDLSWFEQAVA